MKDLARIYIKAGDGGAGSVHFRHEKFAPMGGPDGGDGGAGGDVILVADENIPTLVDFNFKKRFVAKNGQAGMGKKMHGGNTDDVEILVPVGTEVWELSPEYAEANLRDRDVFETMLAGRKPLADLTKHGQRFTAGFGGKGGMGNFHFRSATNQAPMEHEEGIPGEVKWLLLELKVVADIGIMGLPNVGKSSILKALTRANPKIAGYPFTTLEPNLGVARVNDKKIVLVDVPGVVEAAWEGKGIGPWFMRHLERCSSLIHVLALDVASTDQQTNELLVAQLVRDYHIVRRELEKYGRGLPEKEELVVVNKMELVDERDREAIEKAFREKTGKDLLWVSAAMGEMGSLLSKIG